MNTLAIFAIVVIAAYVLVMYLLHRACQAELGRTIEKPPRQAYRMKRLPLRVDCAWCGKVMRKGVHPISHGMCPGCATQFHAEAVAEKEATV